MADTLDTYRQLADDFSARANAVPPADWDRQSPCSEWKARDVVVHVVGVARSNLARLEGAPAASPGDLDAVYAAGVEAIGDPADPAALTAGWAATRAEMEAALADPERAGRVITTAMGALPFEVLVGRFVATDLLVHTWDLARAAGLDERLNQNAVAHAYEGLKPMDAMMRGPGFFAPKVDPPPGADLQTEFLCFLGRPV